MEIKDLQKTVLSIREKYSEYEKSEYGKSWSTKDITMGLVGDVGDLVKLVMAKEGVRREENIGDKLAYEITNCIWSLLVIADKYDLDLEKVLVDSLERMDNNLDNVLS
jgi:phosphoribosyl-ATP pyrophosphohydrolase